MNAIRANDVERMVDQDGATLINTLPRDSFDDTRLPGAINIPQQERDFVQQVEQEVGDKNQPVVVYCASADCDSSTQAARKLESAGFTQVYDFEGGAQEWLQSGHALEGAK